MADRQAESYKADFEQELLRLLQENNKLLQSIDDKVRKIVLNTSNMR
jgi:hypothetical protein